MMDIHLSQIDVRIGSSEKELFKISDFKIKFKDKILIKGESGKGKTTLKVNQ